ncbi:MAG: helicase-associated domain-containing protein [Armatimonadota bacterium]
MQLSDHLNAFSVEDLRELAARRRLSLPPSVMQGRQTLVTSLSAMLGQYHGVYGTISELNRAETAVLRHVLCQQRPSLSHLVGSLRVDEQAIRETLDSLRLWGLIFPEGSWEHIAVPPATKNTLNYLPKSVGELDAASARPPRLETVDGTRCDPRPGSLSGDLAELLARIARVKMKVTQAGRMNRRDLRSMEAAFLVSTSGYAAMLWILSCALRLVAVSSDGSLLPTAAAESWLAQEEGARAPDALATWEQLRGYPEGSREPPEEAVYVPQLTQPLRQRTARELRGLAPEQVVSTASLSGVLQWHLPKAFAQHDSHSDAELVTARLVRSLYWQGLVAVDDPERPRHFRLTPLGLRTLRGDASIPLVPEEHQFFLQPNAEIFAPPNLSPWVLFHLRRFTGEKKGGPAGMYPVNADSLRRAFDSGVKPAEVRQFLEGFSRTGLPGNVAELIQTTGRQHGRIRIVPAGFVLVTDDPALLDELGAVRTVSELVGERLTERAALVEGSQVGELLRRLRARGYAPANEAETQLELGLPASPETAPPPPEPRPAAAPAVDWSILEAREELVIEPGEPVAGDAAVLDLLKRAKAQRLEVELLRRAPRSGEGRITLWPTYVDQTVVDGYCPELQSDHSYKIAQIESARLTGESFAGEYL